MSVSTTTRCTHLNCEYYSDSAATVCNQCDDLLSMPKTVCSYCGQKRLDV